MTQQYAKTIVRRGPSFPFRNRRYFDATPWGGGYIPAEGIPGAVVLNDKGELLNLRSGEVYVDARFAGGAA